MSRCAMLLMMLAALGGCAIRPHAAPHDLFDEETATTTVVAATPLVFARERSDVAAHARDYATLVAVEVDRSGDYGDYMLLYRWSTVDRRMSPPPAADQGELHILADGRRIELTPLPRLPVNFTQRRELHVPDHSDVVPRAYRADAAMLRFIAGSRDLALRMPQEALSTPFTLWKDGRAALLDFLKRTTAP